MKTLIVYYSKHGFTKNVADQMAKEIGQAQVVAFREDLSLDNVQRVLLGSSLYFGQLPKPLQGWIKRQKDRLLEKELHLFHTGMLAGDQWQDAYPKELLEHAVQKKALGGCLDGQGYGVREKLLIKMIKKSKDLCYFQEDHLQDFVRGVEG